MQSGINFVITDGVLYLSLSAQVARADISATQLESAFNKSNCKNCLLDDNAFDKAVNQLASDDDSLIAIGKAVPASLTLDIDEDKLQVTAHVVAPHGGPALTMNAILKVLREHGVTHGIRRQVMEKLVLHSQQAAAGDKLNAVIARGRPPANGSDAQFKALAADARERVLRPKQLDDAGKVDMRDLGEILSVEPGTPLLQRIPPTPGSAGFNVHGETVEPIAGVDQVLKPGDGTQFDPKDNNILVATRHGLPRIVANSAHVDDVLSMRKVDATTGHVNYEGSIVIQGNVGPGMRVESGGDVTVTGYVDSAIIRAKGNITITKGVIGQQSEAPDEDNDEAPVVEHSTQVIAEGSIWVSYSQYATLKGEHGVFVDKQLTHCHVVTGGTLCLGGEQKEARGKLIGGVVDAASHVYAGQIGAPAGASTEINFATPQPTPDYLASQERLSSELAQELQHVKKLSKVRDKARKEMTGDKRKRFLSTLDQKLENHRRNVTVLRIQAQELRKRAPERQILTAYANRVLYSGVIFRSDHEVKRIDENRGPSTLVLKNGSFTYQYVG